MAKKFTIKDLQAIKDRLGKRIQDRREGLARAEQTGMKQVLVCASTGCLSNKSHEVINRFKESIKETGLTAKAEVYQTGCHGLCALGPVVLVYPEGIFYCHVKVTDVDKIVKQHLLGNQPVKELMFKNQLDENGNIIPLNQTKFYKHQIKIALKNSGVIDPENIEEYIAADGYFALHKVLTQMKPADVINEISESKLRGRGGGGFPTGLK